MWQGSAGDRRPYADLVGNSYLIAIMEGLPVIQTQIRSSEGIQRLLRFQKRN